jgi:hypothetical protein
MKKILLIITITIVAGMGAILWGYWQSNSVANDPEPELDTIAKLESSKLGPSDDSAKPAATVKTQKATFEPRNNEVISGTVTLRGNIIRLEGDFRTENGPDLFLYIGDATDRRVEIAKLKAANGAQNYTLLDSIDPDSITHIWIYCRAFDLNFAVAEL